jgi:hypothetical protein
MSKSKIDRALYGPSWAEVIFGALLSFVLGIALAIVFLLLKPVQVVRDLPKEPVRGVVYVIQGSKDANKGRGVDAKLKELTAGRSVSLTEDELNSMFGGKNAATAPNFRIVEGRLQIGLPTTVDLLGLNQALMVVATGQFGNRDGKVSYEVDDFRVGSLPASRLPYIKGAVTDKILAAQEFPPELTAIWGKLASIAIEGNALKLKMP